MMRLSVLFLSLAMILTASSVRAEPGVMIPMMPYGPYPAIPVKVNGTGPYLFLIDTGANGFARIDTSVAEKLKLPQAGTTSASTVLAEKTIQLPRVRADLQIGTQRFAQVEAVSNSYNTVDYLADIGGILAFDLFKDQLLTLDFCHRLVRIENGSLPASNGRTILDYEDRDGVPYLPIRIGDQRVTALLDTGDVRALDLPTSVVRQLYLASYPRLLGRPSVSLTVQTEHVNIVTLEDPVVIGGESFHRTEATFSADWSLAIMGSSLFRDSVLTFDQRNRRVKIERPGSCHATRQ